MTGIGALLGRPATPDGLLRFDPGRDLRAVVDLLGIGFQGELEDRDRQWLSDLGAMSAAGPLLSILMRVFPPAASGLTGFVWYEDGHLVGNASLMRATDDIWIVANVVTRPAYRRRGIAGRLMDAVLDSARGRDARQIQLQVRSDNEAAQVLYDNLGFSRMLATTKHRLRSARAAERLARPAQGVAVRKWGREGTQKAQRLLVRADAQGAGVPPGLIRADLRTGGIQGWFDDWLHMRKRYRWAAVAGQSFRGAVIALASERSGPHQLEVVTDPLWRGRVEAPLVDAALIALARHMPFEVTAEVDARETGALEVLEHAGFTPVRTLDRLKLDLR